MSRSKIISNCEKTFLLKSLKEWIRLDGRAFDEFRELEIKFGKDLGCCYVSLGKTHVLAQVSCEVQQPKTSRPSEGVLNINLELNPIASPEFEPGRPSDLCVQLNRLLEKCFKDSKAVDLESLCIKVNEKVWVLKVDINVLNYEGNILDCASIAALTALCHFKRPDVTCDGEEFIIHSSMERDPIPIVIHHHPVCVTYSVFNGGEYILADPDLLEEGIADAFLALNLNSYKELCGLHLGGKADLSSQMIIQIANKAANRAITIIQLIKDSVEADNKLREEKCSVGFHNYIDKAHKTPDIQDLSECLDQWNIPKTKHKKKKKEKRDKNDDCIEVEIKSIGENSTVALPQDKNESASSWIPDSDEENV